MNNTLFEQIKKVCLTLNSYIKKYNQQEFYPLTRKLEDFALFCDEPLDDKEKYMLLKKASSELYTLHGGVDDFIIYHSDPKKLVELNTEVNSLKKQLRELLGMSF